MMSPALAHHSDRPIQYRAIRHTQRLAKDEAVASDRSKADSYNNAMAEVLHSVQCRLHPPMVHPQGN